MLMTQASETHELTGGCPEWVQANDRAVGYYRVDYKGGLLAALTSGDSGKRLSAAERVDLMGTAQALTDAGKRPSQIRWRWSRNSTPDPRATLYKMR